MFCRWPVVSFLSTPKVFINASKLLILVAVIFITVCWSRTYHNLTRIDENQVSSQTVKEPVNRLLDLADFRLLQDSSVCDKDVFLLLLIHSATEHFELRNVIRNTWGSSSLELPGIQTVFLLAVPTNDSLQERIAKEGYEYGDIVQGNFVDSYKNLTYKHAMGLRWAHSHCSRANYIMKMDDDIFVDIYQLVNVLKNQFSNLGKRVACFVQRQMPVVRDPVSKWFVSKDEYPKDIFDNYCSGWAYITTPKSAGEMYRVSTLYPYFWVDDVHFTGKIAKKAGVVKVPINRYFSTETEPLNEWIRSKTNMAWDKIFAPTWGDVALMRVAHERAKRCHNERCVCCYVGTTKNPILSATKAPPTGKSSIVRIS